MRIPECIVQAAEWRLGETFNHVTIECGENEKERIKELFSKEFVKSSIKEMTSLVDKYGDGLIGLYSGPEDKVVSAYEEEMTIGLEIMELEGYFWSFNPMELESYGIVIDEINEGLIVTYPVLAYVGEAGDYLIGDSNAVKWALRKIIEQYPDCSYAGYEAYSTIDVQSSEFSQKSISSDYEQKMMEFVAKKLNIVIKDYDFLYPVWELEFLGKRKAAVKAIREFELKLLAEIEAKTYDFIGKKINLLVKDIGVWEKIKETGFDYDMEEIIEFFEQYKEYVSEEDIRRIKEIL